MLDVPTQARFVKIMLKARFVVFLSPSTVTQDEGTATCVSMSLEL